MSECDCRETCLECDCETCHKESLLWALEHKFSMRILMCLEVRGPCTFKEMAAVVTDGLGSEKMIFLRFLQLRELGLVECVREDGGQSGAKIRRQLTPEGHKIARKLLELFGEADR